MRVKKTKYFLVVGVLLAIAGVTLGFAAFSNTLTISSSATVTPDASTFSVKFSSSATELKEDLIKSTFDQTITATIDNSVSGSPKLKDIHLKFENPGDEVIFDQIYLYNAGEYTAYWHMAETVYPEITCTAQTDDSGNPLATQSLVDAACEDIKVTEISPETTSLAPGEFTTIYLYFQYDPEAARADGPFTATLSDIQMVWSSVDD